MIRQLITPERSSDARFRSAPVDVITSTTRLARELGRQWDADQVRAGIEVWESPRILPIGAWCELQFRQWLYGRHVPASDSSCFRHLLSDSEEWLVWERIVRESMDDNVLLDVAATASAAEDAWKRICRWMMPIDRTQASEWADTSDAEMFAAWASRFVALSEAGGWLSRSALPTFIASRIEAGDVAVPGHVVLAGFLEMAPAERRLVGAMEAARCRVTVEPGRGPVPDVGRRGRRRQAVRAGFADAAGEVRAAARWARARLADADSAGDADVRIGIVVPDLAGHRSRIERVFAETFHPNDALRPERDRNRVFNISLGLSLARYPLVDAALEMLELDSDPAGCHRWSRILRSPFLGDGIGESNARARLDFGLRQAGEPAFDARLVRSQLARSPYREDCPDLARHLDAWERVREDGPERTRPSRWAQSFARELEAWGWPGDRSLSSPEYQTVEAWNALLEEFAALDRVVGVARRDRAIRLLRRLATVRLFQPETGDAPIQVLGVVEAWGLEFDHVWLLGMHDLAWPETPHPNPFLPIRLQQRYGLPEASPQVWLEQARNQTTVLLASSGSTVVGFPRRDGDTDLRPSPLFAGLAEAEPGDLLHGPDETLTEQVRRSARLESFVDDDAPGWAGFGDGRARGGTSIFKLQAACPFRAFAELRLGASSPVRAETGLGPRDRGALIHDALDRVWAHLGSHQELLAADPDRVESIISLAVGAALGSLAETRAVLRSARFRSLEHERLRTRILELLEVERQRSPFEVVEQETRQEVTVGGLDLTVRADRVDRLEDDRVVVIDYKTAEHHAEQWDGDRPEEPQLPLYAVTARDPVAGVLFGILKAGKTGYRGRVDGWDRAAVEALVPGVRADREGMPMAARIDGWRDVLERLADEFRGGVARVDPRDGKRTCTYCDLSTLCRIGEHRSTASTGSDATEPSGECDG